jgi:hypothetical protein
LVNYFIIYTFIFAAAIDHLFKCLFLFHGQIISGFKEQRCEDWNNC